MWAEIEFAAQHDLARTVEDVLGRRVPLLLVDPDAADEWKKDVPRARVVKMPGVGHTPQWENPRQVTELLLDYTR